MTDDKQEANGESLLIRDANGNITGVLINDVTAAVMLESMELMTELERFRLAKEAGISPGTAAKALDELRPAAERYWREHGRINLPPP